jgi:hypothetical protein
MERSAIRVSSALTEIAVICETTATPIPDQHSSAGISMQRGRRPRGWRGHQSMLDRVEMNVVGAAFEIAVIASIGSLSRISLFASSGLL